MTDVELDERVTSLEENLNSKTTKLIKNSHHFNNYHRS